MNCVLCGKPLSGGTDTFGPIDAPACLDDHWFLETPDPKQDGLSGVAVKDIAYLESEIARVNGELYDKRCDLSELEAEIDGLEDEERDYQRQLNDLQREAMAGREKLALWQAQPPT